MSLKRLIPLLAAVTACRSTAVPEQKSVVDAAVGTPDAGLASIDAGAPAAEASPFVAIAHVDEMRLERITGSPVLGVDASSNLVWALEASGTPRLVEPLALRVLASERNPYIAIGRIAGHWPSMHVELGFGTGRGEPTVHNFVVDDAKQTARAFRPPFGHIATSSPWIDGSELAFGAWETSAFGMSPKGGSFVIVDGPKRPVPKVPETLQSVAPVIVAYDTGRVFFLGGVMHGAPDHDYDEKNVWSLSGTSATPMPLKGPPTHLVRGRSETETLVTGAEQDDPEHGGPAYLVRFDGSAWREVPLPFHEAIRAISAGDDGTVWIASGVAKHGSYNEGGSLWRGVFPDLRFERVPLPAGLTPAAVSATSARDVWVLAADRKTPLGGTLLHTQSTPVAKVEDLPSDAVEIARLTIGKHEPAPWTPACQFGFLSFGTEGERTQDELVAFGKAQPDWPWTQSLVLARLPSGDKIWGTDVYAAYPKPEPEDLAHARTLQKRAQAHFKGAKLLCTALPIEREVEVVPRPPPVLHRPPPGAHPRKKE